MKKIFIALVCIPFISFSQNGLLFSEYGEGSAFNKWIEVYNPSLTQSVSLDNYSYNFCWNGCDSLEWEFSISLDSGYVLLPGEIYLIVHYNADTALLNASNQITNILGNGDDVVALYNKSTDIIEDIIGVFDSIGINDGWNIGDSIHATKNHTLIRKTGICSGNMGNWSLSDCSIAEPEWIVGIKDNFDDVGIHTCYSTNSVMDFNSKNKSLIKVTNILGQQSNNYNKMLLYIYDDGSVIKRIIID